MTDDLYNRRNPLYLNDDSDFSTNAESYYKDLSRKQRLIKELSLIIVGYDEKITEYFKQWQDNLDNFDDNVILLLEKWIDDGTFADIINDELFGTINNVNDSYISPLNYPSLDEAIAYADEHNKIIKTHTILLTKDTTLQGIGLEIENIFLNGFKLNLGGHNITKNAQLNKLNPTQSITNIHSSSVNEKEKVFIRGASYQVINIKNYDGTIAFRMNDFDNNGRGYINSDKISDESFIAYSTFNFKSVSGIDVKNDFSAGYFFPNMNLWHNENSFNLENTYHFTLDGTYPHNLNRIHGGCFEGNGTITIIKGQDNTFDNIRAEGNLHVEFGETTVNNRIMIQHSWYRPTLKDLGLNNRLIKLSDLEMRLIDTKSIVAPKFTLPTDTVSYNLYPFKNLMIDPTSPDCFKMTDSIPDAVLYESPFLDNPKNMRFLVEGNLKRARGFIVTYHLFDANYVELPESTIGQFYALTTFEEDYNENDIGLFIAPKARAFNSTFGSLFIKNDKLNLTPTTHWNTSVDKLKPKYVKFVVRYGNAQSQINEVDYFQIYDLRVSIFDYASNYRDKYTGNFRSKL